MRSRAFRRGHQCERRDDSRHARRHRIGYRIRAGHVTFAIVALALSALLDGLDGTIARECAAPSPLGGVLDLTADRVVEACVIVGIAWRDPALYLPALVLVATWYVNITVFLAVGAALEGPSAKLIEYPPGILERTEAIIFFIVLGLLESTPICAQSPRCCATQWRRWK